MGGPTEDIGAETDTGRAEGFSDGVLAIVITLLVLDLRMPEVEPGRLLSELLEQWPSYAAYVASYLYIAVVWLNHKATFGRIRRADRGLHWMNLLVLFSTALLPFPTSVLSRALQEHNLADQRVAAALYALVGAVLSASWLAFYHYLATHRELLVDGVDERFFPSERLRAVIGLVLYAVAGLLGVLVTPLASLVIFILLPPFYGLTSGGLYSAPLVSRGRTRGGAGS
ncbi:TMEM175 family protein [Plantactinospora sp. BB1]|uniref:TMEM175 family protein n=1 Tax=Plantactinospora sp. BB1 TaxID=2071627 RepID=UPI0018FEE317|nr:TMEM175 family protein [Plantactinospora sp. BB1]